MNDSTTEYRGASLEAADAAYARHAPSVADAGFHAVAFDRRIEFDEHVLVITWRYSPPAVVQRTYHASNQATARADFMRDVEGMAQAGYVPSSASWQKTGPTAAGVVAFGVLSLAMKGNVLTVAFTYDPSQTGASTIGIPSQTLSGPGWGRPIVR